MIIIIKIFLLANTKESMVQYMGIDNLKLLEVEETSSACSSMASPRPSPLSELQEKSWDEMFRPHQSDYDAKYSIIRPIYETALSATVVHLAEDNVTGERIIRKQIKKSKLFGDLAYDYARQEGAIHSLMHHENVVKLHSSFETDTDFTLFMEYCGDQADYLEERIADRLNPIRNTQKLQSYV